MKKLPILCLSTCLVFSQGFALGESNTNNNEVINQESTISENVNDGVISTKIMSLYALDSGIKSLKINVNTENGVVYLDGTVNTDQQYNDAVRIAQSVDGVSDVNAEKLNIKDSSQPVADMLITSKIEGSLIKNKIMQDKDVKFWSIGVETKNGVVYLSGKVDNLEQKNNIVNISKKISGVKSVNAADLLVESDTTITE